MSSAATSPARSRRSTSASVPSVSSSKYTSSPPDMATTTWPALAATLDTRLRPGAAHSTRLPFVRTWRRPPACTCSMEPSDSSCTCRVATSPFRPESLTSATVSPTASTSVPLVKLTTMYLSSAASTPLRTVHTPVGVPGSGERASSDTLRPGRITRNDERCPRPQRAYTCLVSSLCRFSTFIAVTGLRLSTSSTSARFFRGRGVKNTGSKPPSVSTSCLDEHFTSAASPMPANE
mmetsp:Transcript_6469/g.26326  ORF Transcript_6469/g.26326 Transcript_6469/m.26326 type:complete len:235 (+) Transcript_6469:676-1380(+)